MKHRFRNIYIVLIVLVNAGCDQITKNFARNNLDYNETVSVMNGHVVFTKIENYGAFLSTGDSLSSAIKFIFLTLLPSLALLYAVYFLLSRNHLPKLLVSGICFVAGGGMGNLYDRLMYRSVTDFLFVDFYVFKTGIFNLADVSIAIGMLMIIVHLYFRRKKIEMSNP